jgi:GT2 family glycosyltransferase
MLNTSNPKLSIIIVSYNTKDFLIQCLTSIFEQTASLDFEVIVVDNNSMDESIREVKAKFPQVRVVVNETNQGFAKASNQGLRLMKGKYALLLNPDTVVLNNALSKMVKFMEEHKRTGILGCQILNGDGSLQRAAFPPPSLWTSITSKLNLGRFLPGGASHYYRYHLERLFPPHLTNCYYDHKYKISQKPFRVGWVSGASLLIRKNTIKDVGFLDENLFLFGEDADWCCRAREKNWGVMLMPQAQIIHFGGMSTSEFLFISIGSSYYSRLYFAKKYFGCLAVFTLRCISFLELLAKFVTIKLKFGITEQERESRLKGYQEGFKIIFSKLK